MSLGEVYTGESFIWVEDPELRAAQYERLLASLDEEEKESSKESVQELINCSDEEFYKALYGGRLALDQSVSVEGQD